MVPVKKVRWKFCKGLRAMCGLHLEERKISMNFVLMLSLNKTIDQLVMVNSVCWHGNTLKRKDGHAIRRALYFEAESQKMKGRPKRTCK